MAETVTSVFGGHIDMPSALIEPDHLEKHPARIAGPAGA